MVLETFAVTGGTPSASRVGNVTSVPDPTTVLISPAAAPAASRASSSSQLTAESVPTPDETLPPQQAPARCGRGRHPPPAARRSLRRTADRRERSPAPALRRSPPGPCAATRP